MCKGLISKTQHVSICRFIRFNIKPLLIMKKLILALIVFFVSLAAWCQTPAGTFTVSGSSTSLTAAQFTAQILKSDLEDYRLVNQRTTLAFDNGYSIEMLSANEAQDLLLIPNVSRYPDAFPAKFKMPVFHLLANGKIAAGYQTFLK